MRVILIPLVTVLSTSVLALCGVMMWIGEMLAKRPISNDLTLGDLDGDGDIDAFFANGHGEAFQPNTVAWNNGTGQFSDSGQRLGRPLGTYSAALGDLDADGDLDALVGNMVSLQVAENDGRGRFIDGASLSIPGESGAWRWGVALGDLDGDGDLDAFGAGCCGVSASSGARRWVVDSYNMVWLNDGTGHFRDSGQQLGDLGSVAVMLGDLDGDGDLDAFVGNSHDSSGVSSRPNQPNKVWLNDGRGQFGDSGQSLGSAETQALELGDVDGDGDLDAFVVNLGPSEVWLNDGSGNFSDSGQALGTANARVVIQSGRRRFVALADLDTDGDLDAFVGDKSTGRIWLNDGTGKFGPSDQSMRYSERHAVALGDVDGDGTLDIFAGRYDHDYRVWYNDGAGHFSRRDSGIGTLLDWLAGGIVVAGLGLLCWRAIRHRHRR